jgi:nitric oxide reductase subunit B
MAYMMRELTTDGRWAPVEKYLRVGFWGLNIGLVMMILLSLFPGGLLQVWDVLQNGYWHARSLEYTGSALARTLEWMRTPGDLVFIFVGVLPIVAALLISYRGMWRGQTVSITGQPAS